MLLAARKIRWSTEKWEPSFPHLQIAFMQLFRKEKKHNKAKGNQIMKAEGNERRESVVIN